MARCDKPRCLMASNLREQHEGATRSNQLKNEINGMQQDETGFMGGRSISLIARSSISVPVLLI